MIWVCDKERGNKAVITVMIINVERKRGRENQKGIVGYSHICWCVCIK